MISLALKKTGRPIVLSLSSQGLKAQFGRAAQWAQFAETGHWPDADMLPIGYLGPHTLGEPRLTKFTHDEQRTLLTLFAMLRSPLMIGGNLPFTDSWTTSLLTNPDVIQVNQHSTSGHPLITTADIVIWLTEGERPPRTLRGGLQHRGIVARQFNMPGKMLICEGLIWGEFSAGLRKSEAVPLGDPVVPVLDGFVG
jgi:Alpha galactosidase A